MTLLPGDNSDYDYSALSCTSDATLHPAFLPPRQPLKGVFYRRAQRLRPQDKPNPGGQPQDHRRPIIINVGGIRYSLPWTTLEQFPLTRLGQLGACTNFDDILAVCDDYDVTCNEFFFDRHPGAFGTILTFLRAGKLRLLREMCALSFQEELLYWGIAEDHLDGCCKRHYLQKMEEFSEMMQRDDEEDDEELDMDEDLLDTDGPPADEGRLGHCMRTLRDMVERPHSGLPGKVFACLSVLFVTVTAVNLSVSTLPSLREEEEQVRHTHTHSSLGKAGQGLSLWETTARLPWVFSHSCVSCKKPPLNSQAKQPSWHLAFIHLPIQTRAPEVCPGLHCAPSSLSSVSNGEFEVTLGQAPGLYSQN